MKIYFNFEIFMLIQVDKMKVKNILFGIEQSKFNNYTCLLKSKVVTFISSSSH